MFGHKWERATGKVVEARSGIPSGAGQPPGWEIVVELNKQMHGRTRFVVYAPAALPALAAGTPIAVEVEGKSGQARLPSSSALSTLKGVASSLQVMVQEGGGITINSSGPGFSVTDSTGTPAPAGDQPASPMQQALQGQFNVGGANLGSGIGDPLAPAAEGLNPMQQALLGSLRHTGVSDATAAQVAQGLMSGDHAQRSAAIAALRQIKSGQSAPAFPAFPGATGASPASGSAAPPPTPPTFSSPPPAAPTYGSAAPPPTPPTFSSPTVQPVFPASTGPAGTADPFVSSSQAAQNDMRIARLTALRDQGLISNAEFEAQSKQAHEEF
jgi:hypothetical protein